MTQVEPTTAAVCTAARHAGSNEAWRGGCRCPEALTAHSAWLDRHRVRLNRLAPSAMGGDGVCRAGLHDTVAAYQRHGCRCAEAVAAWDEDKRKRSLTKRKKRNIQLAEAAWRESAHARRVTGGRLSIDPRKPWRGGKMAVGRINLWMLIHGFSDSPTMGERMVAIILLRQTWTRGAWFERTRRMNGDEIAARIGVSPATAHRLMGKPAELAGQRTARRLADRKWKDAVAAGAAGRAAGEASRHAAAQAAHRARRLFYARTARRLTRSKERAARLSESLL
jgi:hypothetical protein